MRVGVSLHRTGSAPQLAELAHRLEDEGYDQLQVADHIGFVAPFSALAGRPPFGSDGLAERIAHVRAAAGERADEPELQVLVQHVATGDHARLAELGVTRLTAFDGRGAGQLAPVIARLA